MMVEIQIAIEPIRELIAKHRATDAILTEADVAEVFVAPLFAALGWDTLDPLVWNRQRYVRSGGYADAALQVQHRPVLFVEVKRFGRIVHPQEEVTVRQTLFGDEMILSQAERAAQGIDRTPEEKQAMRYARAAGIRWAVLTNFERLILFNADEERVVLAFDAPDEYLARPDDLALLAPADTPEQFDSRLQWYADLQKKPEIDDDFYRFLSDWRIKLAQVIYEHNWKGETLPEGGEVSYAHLSKPPLTAVPGKGAPPRHLLCAPDGSLDMDRLRQTVQRTLDRLILLRYADDVGFLAQHDLLESQIIGFLGRRVYVNEYEFQQDINRLSHNFYRHHNTTIFAPGHVCERVRIPNDTLVDLVRAVSGISFRKFASDILGNTYESYLGQRLMLDGETIRAESDRRLRKSGGIYYTPSYIVRYIVDHTLGRWLYGTADGRPDGRGAVTAPLPGASRKTLADLDGLRILDPAMGSGSFLIYAFEVLADFYESENARVRQENAARWDAWGQRAMKEGMFGQDNNVPEMGKTTPDYVSRILQEHLYGVDLDPEAAEIAGVNLILRAFDRLKGQRERRKLPLILGQNLKAGNSLIGGVTGPDDLLPFEEQRRRLIALRRELAALREDAAREKKLAQIEAVAAPMNKALNISLAEHFDDVPAKRPFNWEIEFPEVFDPNLPEEERGFTIVVGNPPYISVINIPPEERKYLLNYYQTALGRFDVYITFIERGLSLTQAGGKLSYINPIKFAVYANGKLLRERLLQEFTIEGLVDVSQCSSIFPDPTTYPSIWVIGNHPPATDHFVSVSRVLSDEPELILQSEYTGSNVEHSDIPQARWRAMPEQIISPRLSDFVWGVVERTREDKFNSLGQKLGIEQCIRIGSAAKRHRLILSAEQYHQATQQQKALAKPVIDGSDIKRYNVRWPETYLLYVPDELYNPKSIELLEQPKLLVKRVSSAVAVAYDPATDRPFYPLNTIYALVPRPDTQESLLYFLALVNSRYLDWLYRVLFGTISVRGGYLEYREYLKYLPVYSIDFADPADVAAHDRLVTLAQRMLDLNRVRQAMTGSFATAIRAYERTFIPLRLFLNEQRDFVTRHALLDANDEGEVNGIGVEEQERISESANQRVSAGSLLLRAEVEGAWHDVVRLGVEDEDLRLYLLLALRAFLDEKRRKRVWSRGKILNGVLKALQVPRLATATPEAHQRRVAEVLTDVRRLLPPDLPHHDAGLDRHGAPLHLSAVEADIATTDAEIDRCVYDLYGLSEEERRIVEESLTT